MTEPIDPKLDRMSDAYWLEVTDRRVAELQVVLRKIAGHVVPADVEDVKHYQAHVYHQFKEQALAALDDDDAIEGAA